MIRTSIKANIVMNLIFKKSIPSTEVSITAVEVLIIKNPLLEYLLCIYNLLRFKKKQAKIQVFLDRDREINK